MGQKLGEKSACPGDPQGKAAAGMSRDGYCASLAAGRGMNSAPDGIHIRLRPEIARDRDDRLIFVGIYLEARI
jgi:hypothetical protein